MEKKINIHEYIQAGGKGYISYIASVAGKESITLSSFLSRLKNGGEGNYSTRVWIVEAINKIEKKDYIVSDFDWTGTPGKWHGTPNHL